jgi:hypothetical protein
MVAPIDAKATFQVEDETITLRLNFRSISLAERHGLNLLTMERDTALSVTETAIIVKCLAVQEHPDFTEDHALAVVHAAPEALAGAMIELFTSYGGKQSAEGNVKPTRRKAKA